MNIENLIRFFLPLKVDVGIMLSFELGNSNWRCCLWGGLLRLLSPSKSCLLPLLSLPMELSDEDLLPLLSFSLFSSLWMCSFSIISLCLLSALSCSKVSLLLISISLRMLASVVWSFCCVTSATMEGE